ALKQEMVFAIRASQFVAGVFGLLIGHEVELLRRQRSRAEPAEKSLRLALMKLKCPARRHREVVVDQQFEIFERETDEVDFLKQHPASLPNCVLKKPLDVLLGRLISQVLKHDANASCAELFRPICQLLFVGGHDANSFADARWSTSSARCRARWTSLRQPSSRGNFQSRSIKTASTFPCPRVSDS